eukprot:scaffold8659_cov129-Isochrysis_galbana.AAC.6
MPRWGKSPTAVAACVTTVRQASDNSQAKGAAGQRCTTRRQRRRRHARAAVHTHRIYTLLTHEGESVLIWMTDLCLEFSLCLPPKRIWHERARASHQPAASLSLGRGGASEQRRRARERARCFSPGPLKLSCPEVSMLT